MIKLVYKTLIVSFLLWLNTTYGQVPPGLYLTQVANIPNNMGIRSAYDGSGRLFTATQDGTIRIIDQNGQLLSTPFLDISTLVSSGGERGLLGLAFHPDYSQNGYFFVNYTKASPNQGDTIIARYQVSANPDIANPNSATVLMRINQDFSNHNGGNILFGPDGYLYIGMGDGGSGNDPNNRSQDLTQLLGKMLRIDVDGNLQIGDEACGLDAAHYGIPNDNPFVNTSNACDEIWASGLRNPWRWSFDRITGDMYIADVGQNKWEEVNFQAASSSGGENYGWRCREGFHENTNVTCNPPLPTFTDPILELAHSNGNCSITGGYNYRGPVINLQNHYIFTDYCKSQLTLAIYSQNQWTTIPWTPAINPTGVTSFGEDHLGHVYITSQSGPIYRIDGPISDLIFANGFESP
ncbi:MAG: glucose dehydrogenase [Proteobacteria bacterium]|nr:MAG: glucose dehydrogenase [Pseudomonadota bacterium]